MPNDSTHTATCTSCGRDYQQAHTDDCVWADTGRSLGGWNGKWYGYDANGEQVTIDDPETDDRVRIVTVNVYPYGGPYDCCDRCTDRHHDRQQRTDYYDSDVAPGWFDPTYAGESWD